MGYAQEMAGRLPPGMVLPSEFREAFDWMEAQDFFMPSGAFPGDKLGLLGSEDDVQAGLITAILFRVATPQQARDDGRAWFGDVVRNIEERLVPFARTGSDGSHAAFWLDDEGTQRIVHLGSEGLVCLLGQTPLDFLRLLAIGYEEISDEGLSQPTAPPRRSGRNLAFRAWVSDRFGVVIPETAAQILGDVPGEFDESSEDPFWCWVRKQQNARDNQEAGDIS
ncbi:hypothetical protein SAMN05216456_1348 [Devosia crocina]|uniref:Uncharacterized protein n=1 Tax=Devosia crocina TaxID=429728 RepID=A0A1I7N9Z6_9HYPH|nr:hypothetical protein [Devosia crocina]SFV31461.1 hypothetical protein SAMN05216456_1348 [Devosia crocina]